MIPPSKQIRRARFWRSLFVATLVSAGATAAKSQTLIFDGAMTGSPAGGSGIWDAGTTADWYPGTGPTDTVWVNGYDALFGGTAGTATIASGGVSANSVTFNTSGYKIGGGTLTLAGTGTPTNGIPVGTINVNNAGTDTIGSVIAGGVGLIKTGAGTLVLTGTNTFTGALTISTGTLQLGDGTGNGGTFSGGGVTSINVAAGATYALDYLSALNTQGAGGDGTSNTPITGAGNITLLGETNGYYGIAANRNPFQISGTTTVNLNTTGATGSNTFLGSVFLYGSNVLSGNSLLNVLSGQIIDRGGGQIVAGLTNTGIATAGTTNTGGFYSTDQGSATLTINTAPGTSYTYGGVIGKSTFTSTNNNEALVKNGLGTQILTGLNTYTGATTINAGTLTLDATNGGKLGATALTFGGTGTFNYQGAAAGSTQTLGTLTFSAGGGVVQSTYGTSGNTALTFASLGARAAGATGNFVTTGGTNGTTNKISFTNAPATGTVLDPGLFFNGADYATYDAGGFVRAYNYATDANGVVFAGGGSFDTAVGTASNVNMTGAVTAEQTATINTLKVSNNSSLTLASGATLSTNGILQSGNTAGGAMISGGSGIQGTAAGAELVVRTDGANDMLTIATPILGAQTGRFTKSGDGTVIVTGASTIAGPVNVNRGTLQVGDGTSSNAGTLGSSVTALTIGAGATYAVEYNSVINTPNGLAPGVTPTGAGNYALEGNGSGFYSLGTAVGNGNNLAITGSTIINLVPNASTGYFGTVFVQNAGALSANSVLTVLSGDVDLRANNTVLGLTNTVPTGFALVSGTTNTGGYITTDGARGTILTVTPAAGTTYTYSGIVGAANNGYSNADVGITVNGPGTQILAGANNYNAPTTVSQGTLQFGNGTGSSISSLNSTITVAAGANLVFNDNAQEDLTSTVTGAGNVTFQGLGTGYINVNAAETNSGTTTVALTAGAAGATGFQGALFINNGALSPNAVLNVTSGNVDLRSNNTVKGLTGTGGSITTDSNGSLTFTITPAAGTSYVYSGVIGALSNGFSTTGVSLAINGAGTQSLSGASNYSGTTTVNGGGTLLVNGTNSGTGAVTVGTAGGGTGLTGILGGIGTITAAVTVNSGSTLAPNTVGTAGTLRTGALTLTSGANYTADLLSTATCDQTVSSGAIDLTGSPTLNLNGLAGGTFANGNVLTLLSGTSLAGTFSNAAEGAVVYTFDGFNFTADYTGTSFNLDVVTAVPEPATWLGGILGAGILVHGARRRFVGKTASVNS